MIHPELLIECKTTLCPIPSSFNYMSTSCSCTKLVMNSSQGLFNPKPVDVTPKTSERLKVLILNMFNCDTYKLVQKLFAASPSEQDNILYDGI
jgi:hypothetical protein